ncbi:neprilysin-11-like [Dermacentor albipictus]|uniref:neprilysin-11-like n=1 Tax=Dermacentor albipictus TaxID=60249 RepID=UPI0038FCC920
MGGPFAVEASNHHYSVGAPSTTVSRRQMLAKPVSAIRQGSQEYPVSAACALFTCCSLAIVAALVIGLYLFSQSKEGQVMVTKAMRFLRIGANNTKALSTVATRSVDVRVKVDVLSHVTDSSSVAATTTSARPTVKTVPPCKRILCAYQTSRWTLSSAAHPCDDFYSFVCGNWSQGRQNDTSSFGTDQHKETEVLLQTLLEERRAASPKGDAVVSLYDTCLERTSYADSKLFVSSLLQRVGLSKWPYKDNVMSKNEMWNIHARIFRALGISPLVTVSHVPDPKNVSKSVVSLDIPPLYAKTEDDVRLPTWYLPSLYRATSMFDSDFYEDVSQRVLQFVGTLAQLRAKFRKRPRSTTLSSEPFYAALVKYTLEGVAAVKSDTPLQLYNQAFFKALKSLISRTKSSSVYNYLGFCVLVHVSPLLSNEFETMSHAQMAWMSQRWQSSWALWQRCLWFIDDMDPTILLGVFGKYAKTHMHLVNVSSVTERLRRVFRTRAQGLEWCAGERAKSCLSFIDGTSVKLVDLNVTRTTPAAAGNMTTGFFLEEYVALKRRRVETSLAQPQDGWKSVFSLFASAPAFDTKTQTLYLPVVPFFDLFHDADLDLLVRYPYLAHDVYRSLLEQLLRHVFTSVAQTPGTPHNCDRFGLSQPDSVRSVEELVLDATAWELSFRHFSGTRWEGYAFPGNHSTERSFFIFAAMGKCHNAVPEAPSAQLALRSGNEEMHAINEAFANTRVFGNLWGCNNRTIMNPEAKCNLWKS